jgi:hypothetical protein
MSDEWRIGGGMQGRRKNSPRIWGPWRDPGAPRESMKADSGAGLMEWDDSIRNLQLGEGVEEVIWVDEDDLLLPDAVEDTGVEERVLEEYREVAGEESTPVPSGLDVRYVDSFIEVPGTEEVWSFGGYRTGVTEEETSEDSSYELVNFLDMDIPGDAAPYDLEHWFEDGEMIHPDRPVYEVDVETGEAVLYRSGDTVYSGDMEGAVDYLEEHWGEELPGTASTVKVQAAIEGGDWDVNTQVREHLL